MPRAPETLRSSRPRPHAGLPFSFPDAEAASEREPRAPVWPARPAAPGNARERPQTQWREPGGRNPSSGDGVGPHVP